jgi:hypothetical protein
MNEYKEYKIKDKLIVKLANFTHLRDFKKMLKNNLFKYNVLFN